MMSMLEAYARRVLETKGLEHQIALSILRDYMKVTPIEELIAQIDTIYDTDVLKALWEAGLRKPLMDAVIRRIEILQGRRLP